MTNDAIVRAVIADLSEYTDALENDVLHAVTRLGAQIVERRLRELSLPEWELYVAALLASNASSISLLAPALGITSAELLAGGLDLLHESPSHEDLSGALIGLQATIKRAQAKPSLWSRVRAWISS